MDLKNKISKEELSACPAEVYNGRAYVIQTLPDAEKAVNYLRTQSVVGFDTETKPSFVKGRSNQVALMQISTADVCFLFRLNVIGIPPCLLEFLKDKAVMKIGLSLRDDFRALNRRAAIEPGNFLDLQNYVKSFGIEENSLTKIYAIIFGKRISKAQRLSNWEAPLMTERQIAYAALDAWTTREIFIHLNSLQANADNLGNV
ncbi:MAG: 3'-5' exonuclease domain-containing protein 2 [Paludibacteraceae bacterium]|nr:3'-5' exonuclease domain-containing protein 2 [Paludibacteraceae bacterium]